MRDGRQRVLTLEALPEDQLDELTAGGEVRVGVGHYVSAGPQVQDAHWGGGRTPSGHINTPRRETTEPNPREKYARNRLTS